MLIRSMILALAAASCTTDGRTATTSQQTGNFDCGQQTVGGVNVVNCDGTIALMPITIEVHNVEVLSNNEIEVLEGSLNDLSILEGSPIYILNEVEADVVDELDVA